MGAATVGVVARDLALGSEKRGGICVLRGHSCRIWLHGGLPLVRILKTSVSRPHRTLARSGPHTHPRLLGRTSLGDRNVRNLGAPPDVTRPCGHTRTNGWTYS